MKDNPIECSCDYLYDVWIMERNGGKSEIECTFNNSKISSSKDKPLDIGDIYRVTKYGTFFYSKNQFKIP